MAIAATATNLVQLPLLVYFLRGLKDNEGLASQYMTVDDLLAALAASFGVEAPNAQEREQILALAGEAAHMSERQAAPIACWLAGRAGVDLETALASARALSRP